MSHFLNFTNKQKRAEKKMQKLLFGKSLSDIKKCTKKSRNIEIKLLQLIR
jgi:hypothetical protein